MHTNQLLTLLQITDSAFPTGAFSHSNGLEAYTQAGTITDLAGLRALLTTRLRHSLARGDLLLVQAAVQPNADLTALDQLASASKTPLESYEASVKVGRRLLASVCALLTSPALAAYQADVNAGRCAGHHALVFGLACAASDLPCETALTVYAYNAVSGQIAAAVKLLSLGQTAAQGLLHAMQPEITAAAQTARALTLDDYAPFTPALDIRAMQHATLFRRLFIS